MSSLYNTVMQHTLNAGVINNHVIYGVEDTSRHVKSVWQRLLHEILRTGVSTSKNRKSYIDAFGIKRENDFF